MLLHLYQLTDTWRKTHSAKATSRLFFVIENLFTIKPTLSIINKFTCLWWLHTRHTTTDRQSFQHIFCLFLLSFFTFLNLFLPSKTIISTLHGSNIWVKCKKTGYIGCNISNIDRLRYQTFIIITSTATEAGGCSVDPGPRWGRPRTKSTLFSSMISKKQLYCVGVCAWEYCWQFLEYSAFNIYHDRNCCNYTKHIFAWKKYTYSLQCL